MVNKDYDTINKLLAFDMLVSDLGEPWTSYWCYEDAKNKLMEMKDFVAKHKDEVFNQFGYLVNDIYSQIEEFEHFIPILQADTITDTREEAIILTAIHYALIGKKIISPHIRLTSKRIKPDYEHQEFERYYSKLHAKCNLIAFYLSNKNNPDCVIHLNDLVFECLNLSVELINKYPDQVDNLNVTGITISVLKNLLRTKNFSLAKKILEDYKLNPRGKTETTALIKIKEKIYKENKINE